MSRYLLLFVLSCWISLSRQCETGVAYPDHVLSVSRSLMANADVALLKTYSAEDVNQCLKECCTEKYGSCSVSSFKKNATEDNCQHFNCRPVQKCKFLSSSSTDSFSFSSSPSPQVLVPSSRASSSTTTDKPQSAVTKEAIATYSEEPLAFKNDNTSVKPRKGVTADSTTENAARSGVKPRKGVSLDETTVANSTKSKVKPRKGVGPYTSQSTASSFVVEPSVHVTASSPVDDQHDTTTSAGKIYKDIIADDLVSALEKVFEDDTAVKNTKPSATSSTINNIETSSSKSIEITTVDHHLVFSTSLTTQHSVAPVTVTSYSVLQSSLATSQVASTSVKTPKLQTAFVQATESADHTPLPSSSPTIFEHSKLLFHEISVPAKAEESNPSPEESESERKYKSSMHLVLSLVFGLLVLFSVLGVVAKRVYDSWMRRHYRRMDFLIDGMYNGYG